MRDTARPWYTYIPRLIFVSLAFLPNSLAVLWLTLNDEAILSSLRNSPNETDPSLICDRILGLTKKHREMCYHSPAILFAIGEGNRRTLEHLEKVFEEDQLPSSLLIYKSIFSYRIAEGSKREILYLASIRSSAITHEVAVACSDGLSDMVCPCYRPPQDTNLELKAALGTALVLDQGCPYALAHAQRIALDYVLDDPDLTADDRSMIREHAIAAAKAIEVGWIDPEEEWESKFRETEETLLGQQGPIGASLHQHRDL